MQKWAVSCLLAVDHALAFLVNLCINITVEMST